MPVVTFNILFIDEFGAAVLDTSPQDFAEKGFDLGDVINLEFSNGVKIPNVPYFNGFYVPIGEPILVAYPSYEHPAVNYNCMDFQKKTGVRADDTVTISMEKKGGKLDVMHLRGVVYSNDPADYKSSEQFANAREFHVGKISPGKLYRCASPFDHQLNRPEAVDGFLRKHSIQSTFSISESEKTLQERYAAMPPYARKLYENRRVIPLAMGAGYFSEEFCQKLAHGLIRICSAEFPTAIHCLEGKDRTGFVCILLGCLMDADYDEMLSDYMKTFENYYGITADSDPVRYNGFKKTFIDSYLCRFAGIPENQDPRGHNYRKGTEDYLRSGGMSDQQISQLKKVLSE